MLWTRGKGAGAKSKRDEQKKAKGEEEKWKKEESSRRSIAGVQFPKSLMVASTSHKLLRTWGGKDNAMRNKRVKKAKNEREPKGQEEQETRK